MGIARKPPPGYIQSRYARKLLGDCAHSTLYALVKDGKIGYLRPEGNRQGYYSLDDVRRLRAKQRTESQDGTAFSVLGDARFNRGADAVYRLATHALSLLEDAINAGDEKLPDALVGRLQTDALAALVVLGARRSNVFREWYALEEHEQVYYGRTED